MVVALCAGLLAIIVVQRLCELRLAKRNEAWVRARGAVEFGRGHYWAFFVLHVAWLLAWPLEAAWRASRGMTLSAALPLWLLAFGLSQGLRYWSMSTLGRRWTTRILVLPQAPPISSGPYRLFAHPSYTAVIVELAVVPAAVGAWLTALCASLANLALLGLVRIPAEERALGQACARVPSD